MGIFSNGRRPYRLGVRTPDSHSGNGGSIPPRAVGFLLSPPSVKTVLSFHSFSPFVSISTNQDSKGDLPDCHNTATNKGLRNGG